MKKKLLLIIGAVLALFSLTGCDSKNTSSTMTAYSSVYPVEYILENLYGENIAIYSIYPDGIDYKGYKLNNKQLSDYSKGDLFVYNGTIKNEKDYAVKLLNKNKNIKIIDSALGMNYTSAIEENWLNPSNYLMMASNIKKGLEEYINENIEIKKIDANYEEIKLSLSQIDAEMKQIATSSNNPVIIVDNDVWKFLEKYGLKVISLEENDNLTDKTIADAKKVLENKQVKYIFLTNNKKANKTIKALQKDYPDVTLANLNTISTLSATERKDKKDYISLMNENINSIKLEINK